MAQGVEVLTDGIRIALSGAFAGRVLETRDGVLRTTELTSKPARTTLSLDSQEFRLALADGRVLTSDAFRVGNWEHQTTPAGGRRVTVHLNSQPERLDARVVYELEPDDFYVRKRLLFRSLDGDVQVDSLDVEHFTCPAEARLGGRGQPIYLDDTFFVGLEYPAGFNDAADGVITLRHYPSWIRSQDELVSKTAVVGVAPTGEVGAWFARYVERIRRRGKGFVTFNSGADVQIYEPGATPDLTERVEDRLLRCADEFKKNLYDQDGPVLRSFVLDDGWQDPKSLYEVDRGKFPNGFGPLIERLQSMESNLGLWLSLTMRFAPNKLDRDYAESAGFGIVPDRRPYPCISEARYNEALRRILKKHITEHGVVHYKFDFNNFACTSDAHGHLGDEKHGFEANLDAQIEILHYVASLREDITIVPTCGMWLSPWWLMHADMTWPHGMGDFDYGRKPFALEPRDWAITYRDQNLYELFRKEQCQFPISGITTCGCIGGPRYNIAGPLEDPRQFADTIVHTYARQLDLRRKDVGSPMNRRPVHWAIFRAALRWALDRETRVAPGRMVLGQPAEGELYGYAHLGETGGVVSLRNPSAHAQTQTLPLDGLADDRDYRIEVTYPYRRVLTRAVRADADVPVTVGPYGVLVVEVIPAPDVVRPVLDRVRYSIVADEPGRLVCDVWTQPGEPGDVTVRWPGGIAGVEIDGAATSIEPGPTVRLTLPPIAKCETVRVKPLPRVKDKDKCWRNGVRIDVPVGSRARVVLLDPTNVVHAPQFMVNHGGLFAGLPYKVVAGDEWTAYELELDPGDLNAIRWRLTEDDPTQAPDASLWLMLDRPLVSRRITVRYTGADPARTQPELPTLFAGHRSDTIRLYPFDTDAAAPTEGVELDPEHADENR